MVTAETNISSALIKLADGTVKQRNQLTGTEVWTVPGRGHRPLTAPNQNLSPIETEKAGEYCAFCNKRYLQTPPEKSRLLLDTSLPTPENKTTEYSGFKIVKGLGANQIFETVADFRRVPNLFEIVSYQYWKLNHGHEPSTVQHQAMAEYLASPGGYEHVLNVVGAKLRAQGYDEATITNLSESDLLQEANSFFSGGHDLIIGKRHYSDDGKLACDLASSGSLTPDEHYAYTAYTAKAMFDLYHLNPNVLYVTAFQNWLKPAGASFEHLHKQLVAIDEFPVQINSERENLQKNPNIYRDILKVRVTRKLVLAQNDHAVAMAGIGHRYPTISIWPIRDIAEPWEASNEELRSVSDILHAMHAATGANVPCNEEWYHRPPTAKEKLRWRILLKWRISTMAGFEGGTRIYLNTIDPWGVCDIIIPRLKQLRDEGKIADIKIGEETIINPRILD